MPKSRYCEYCLKVKERDELMLCGGCRLLGYCSIECQAADWIGKGDMRMIVLILSIINTHIKSDDFESCGMLTNAKAPLIRVFSV